MESWLGPRPQRGCVRLVPHTCWEESGTHFSLAVPLAAKLSHANLSGRDGMTESPGHSGPSWARSPQGQPPSVAHTHCPEPLEGGPWPPLGTVNER